MDVFEVFNELKRELGLNFNLKEEQGRILDLLIRKRSVVAILNTGFGKSLIFMTISKFLDKVSITYAAYI